MWACMYGRQRRTEESGLCSHLIWVLDLNSGHLACMAYALPTESWWTLHRLALGSGSMLKNSGCQRSPSNDHVHKEPGSCLTTLKAAVLIHLTVHWWINTTGNRYLVTQVIMVLENGTVLTTHAHHRREGYTMTNNFSTELYAYKWFKWHTQCILKVNIIFKTIWQK